MTVPADEFIRRFLIHTLPPGFQRIRHFGFLAGCHRKVKLALCRTLLTDPVTSLLPEPAQCSQMLEEITEKPARLCPHCGFGAMIRIAILPAYRWPAIPVPSLRQAPPEVYPDAQSKPSFRYPPASVQRFQTTWNAAAQILKLPVSRFRTAKQVFTGCFRNHSLPRPAFKPHNRNLRCGLVHCTIA